jgi:phosphatidylglycerol---prolipoprotein diacylglyceryl transferase
MAVRDAWRLHPVIKSRPMWTYPTIDPVAIAMGPLRVHWYGLMYLVGFLAGWWLGRRRAGRPGSGWTYQDMDDFLFYLVLGVILGGRIGYVLFYAFPQLLRDPWLLFRIWEGGMSFHGGLLGVLLAVAWFARRQGKRFFEVTDFLAPLVPIGLGAGRIGNFINGELWGSVTSVAWGIHLPCARFADKCGTLPGGSAWSPPLHPSQLYEAGLEGAALFLILWAFSARPRPARAVSGLFLVAYGVFRIAVEFVRTPDAQIGYLAFGWVTLGQLLSLPMVLAGLALLYLAYRPLARGA